MVNETSTVNIAMHINQLYQTVAYKEINNQTAKLKKQIVSEVKARQATLLVWWEQ